MNYIYDNIRFEQSAGGGTVGAEELQTQLLKVTEGDMVRWTIPQFPISYLLFRFSLDFSYFYGIGCPQRTLKSAIS